MHRDLLKPNVKRLNGPKTQKWTKFHLKFAAPATYHKGLVWDRKKPASGPFFTDVDGNVFLDFVSHVGASPLGYNHPELTALMKKLAINPDRYAGTDIISSYGDDPDGIEIPTPSHLHHKIVEITKQFKFNMAFFSNSGAEAVENAIKAAYDHRKNRGHGFCFYGAFHGRTLGALSLNRSKAVQRNYYPQIPNIVPYHYCCCKEEHCKCEWTVIESGKKMSHLRASLDKRVGIINPKEVSYIIIEPIQGEGGYNVPHPEFMKEIREVASKHNIPLICDEIQSGMGRTGKWWACEHFKMKPDYITAAKALRIGATISNKNMFPHDSGRLSSTWGEGNAIASAIGYKTIEIMQKQKLVENAAHKGEYFLKRLVELQEDHPHHVVDVRGIGLMDALEIDTQKRRDAVLHEALRQGLFLIGCGYKSIRFLPTLDVRKREIDMCIDILDNALKKVK